MSHDDNVRPIDCARAMDAVHRRLDGDVPDTSSGEWLDRHLAGCEACRRAETELRQIQSVLRSMEPEAFPDVALERVWQETTRSPAPSHRPTRRVLAIAAAAVLAALSIGLWFALEREPATVQRAAAAETAPSDRELDRAAREARLVLGLTASALRRTERVAVRRVLGESVSPAIDRIPIRWPESSDDSKDARSEGNGNV
jgi:anti-sigma factor RsiW